MHILVINPYLVNGSSLGGAKRIFRMIRHFAGAADVSLACFSDNFQSRGSQKRSEVYGLCRSVIETPLERRRPTRKALDFFFRPEPASVCHYRSGALARRVREFVGASGVDLVHVEFFDMAQYAIGLPVPKVLVSQEVLSLAAKKNLGPVDTLKWMVQGTKIRRYEKKIPSYFDRTYCITEEERVFLEGQGVRNCRLYTHVIDTDEFAPSDHSIEKPGVLLFVGNYDHKPNRAALVWFLKEIFPLIRALRPETVLAVVGPNFDGSILKGLDTAAVEIRGEVKDLNRQYDEAAVFVNPIVSGGGMRGKVLEAMSKAKAVVSTRLGMQGISVTDRREVMISDDPRGFAEAVAGLLASEEARERMGTAARRLVCGLYGEKSVFDKQLEEYREVINEKISRRAIQ